MPQLVKGGKWIFGLSEVGLSGKIMVPGEAIAEYGFRAGDHLFTMSASRTSGGFILTSRGLLIKTGFDAILKGAADLSCDVPEAVKVGNRWLAGTVLRPDLAIMVPVDILARYGIVSGDYLAVGRGSWAGISFLARGPILEECRRHPELEVFRGEGDMS